MSVLDKIFSIIAWIEIFISPFLIGSIVAFFSWFYFQSIFAKAFAFIIFIVGIVVGIRFAEYARKKKGTLNFISKVNEPSELTTKE